MQSRSKFFVLSIFAAAVFVALLMLGNWQVRRLGEKEQLLQTIQTRMAALPRAIGEYIKTNLGEDYWPVTLEGTYLHEAERHFFATFEGQSGYYVYTPLKIDAASFVLVNRGFVPFELKDAAKRADGQTQGRVSLTGLARSVLSQKPSSVPNNDVTKNIFYWKDFSAMRDSAGLPIGAMVLELFVDADVSATPPSGLPKGGVTFIDLPNNHLQYAGTWYGLAAALLGIWGVLAWRQRRA